MDDFKDDSDTPRYNRDYFVKASRSPTGDPSIRSSSSISQLSETSEEVSRYFRESRYFTREDTKSQVSNKRQSTIENNENFPKHNTFKTLKKLSASHQHFSKVFQTAKPSQIKIYKNKLNEKYQYGGHSLRLTSKPKYPSLFSSHENFEIASENPKPSKFNKGLSVLEQDALFGDVKHLIFRARGASPNFMLNPVFEPNENDSSVESEPIKPHYKPKPDLSYINDWSMVENKNLRLGQESGYGSADSFEYWRLTPPKKPEVLESCFEPALKQRKNNKIKPGKFSRYSVTNFHNFCI